MSSGLTDIARAEIEALTADGIIPTPDEIVRIQKLSERIETGETRRALAAGVPVMIGETALWPLTLYACDWLDRVGLRLGSMRLKQYAIAYAMAHGRMEGALDLDAKQAEKTVTQWARSLPCRYQELCEAVSEVLEQEEAEEEHGSAKESDGTGAGELSLIISALAGGNVEFWERRCSIGYIARLLRVIVSQKMAEGKSAVDDARIRATRALGLYVESIRRKRKNAA